MDEPKRYVRPQNLGARALSLGIRIDNSDIWKLGDIAIRTLCSVQADLSGPEYRSRFDKYTNCAGETFYVVEYGLRVSTMGEVSYPGDYQMKDVEFFSNMKQINRSYPSNWSLKTKSLEQSLRNSNRRTRKGEIPLCKMCDCMRRRMRRRQNSRKGGKVAMHNFKVLVCFYNCSLFKSIFFQL